MTLLANIDSMTPEELNLIQERIMLRKQAMIEKQVAELAETTARLQSAVSYQINELETLKHRVDNVDCTNIDGTLRDRFNKMIRLYATRNGLYFDKAYRAFVQAYNTAYQTNLELRITNYCKDRGIKEVSTPEYLERVGKLEDAVRVADKMLNRRSA